MPLTVDLLRLTKIARHACITMPSTEVCLPLLLEFVKVSTAKSMLMFLGSKSNVFVGIQLFSVVGSLKVRDVCCRCVLKTHVSGPNIPNTVGNIPTVGVKRPSYFPPPDAAFLTLAAAFCFAASTEEWTLPGRSTSWIAGWVEVGFLHLKGRWNL